MGGRVWKSSGRCEGVERCGKVVEVGEGFKGDRREKTRREVGERG